MKETKQEQLARIREAWKPWKERLELERRQREEQKKAKAEFDKKVDPLGSVPRKAIKGIAHGNQKKQVKRLLKRFWEKWNAMESDEIRLAALIVLANKFKVRVADRRLRKMRKKFNRNKKNLLPFKADKCGTCPNRATIRHHLIPLNVGGINSPLNLILICDDCHAEIHPWLKAS